MTATKTKEFMAEMKVLCKVHHTNLVMLLQFERKLAPFSVVYYCHVFLAFYIASDSISGLILSR